MIFNEDKLQEEIIKTWGEFGVHNEVFKAMRKQISDLKQLTLTDVSQSVAKEWGEFIIRCDREGRPLLLLEDYIEQYCG